MTATILTSGVYTSTHSIKHAQSLFDAAQTVEPAVMFHVKTSATIHGIWMTANGVRYTSGKVVELLPDENFVLLENDVKVYPTSDYAYLRLQFDYQSTRRSE